MSGRLNTAAAVLFLLGLLLCCHAHPAAASSFTFFENTQYPLKVYTLKGQRPGPTVMVQGGIQGDEVAGFLTAELLTKARVKSGTLIIIPRANVPSINHHQRQINVDLNRRFDKHYNDFYEDRLARVIRLYLARSDAFLHLHEGSGFYNPVHIDDLHNPKRYGQSVIIDTLVYKDTRNTLHLARTVNDVLSRVNTTVQPARYRFKLFNTDTFRDGTAYAEMRKSLTCYALLEHTIPALAIEVSKNISDLEWKVRQQLKATIKFLEHFGVQLELDMEQVSNVKSYPALIPALFINGQKVNPQSNKAITLSRMDEIDVRIDRGCTPLLDATLALFASDQPRLDLIRNTRYPTSKFNRIELRMDGRRMGVIPVKWKGAAGPGKPGSSPLFVCRLNDELRIVPEGATLQTQEGDKLLLEGVWGGRSNEIINVKGLITQAGSNSGQDAGCEIVLDPDQFIERYFLPSDGKGGKLCRVVRETPGIVRKEFRLRILPRVVTALAFLDESGRDMVIPWRTDSQTPYHIASGSYRLSDAWSSGSRDKLLVLVDGTPVAWDAMFTLHPGATAEVELRHAATFGLIGRMSLSVARFAALSATTGG